MWYEQGMIQTHNWRLANRVHNTIPISISVEGFLLRSWHDRNACEWNTGRTWMWRASLEEILSSGHIACNSIVKRQCSFQLVNYCLLCTKVHLMKICIQDGDPPVNGDFSIIANNVVSEPLTWGASALDVRDSLENILQGIARDTTVERFGTAQVGFNYSISYQR